MRGFRKQKEGEDKDYETHLAKAHSMDKGCVIPFTLHLIKQLLPGHVKNGNSLQ